MTADGIVGMRADKAGRPDRTRSISDGALESSPAGGDWWPVMMADHDNQGANPSQKAGPAGQVEPASIPSGQDRLAVSR